MSARHRVPVPLSRRRFGVLLSLGGATLAWPFRLPAASARADLSPSLRQWLTEALRRKDPTYDPFARMLVAAADTTTGHPATRRSGDVHPTQASLTYAAGLLDSAERWRFERARDILRAVLILQDQDAESRSYGQWPWCLEEPLPKDLSSQGPPPASDTGEGCTAALLMIWVTNRQQLGAALEQSVGEAIVHAARSIQRREVDPAQTRLAILGTGIALVAAQEFKLNDLRTDAKARLRRLYDHVVQAGSFTEYNSPVDSLLILQELARTRYLVRDAREKTLLSAIYELAWKHVARHFHSPSQQWAGPHSRIRETSLASEPAALAFLQNACGERVRFRGVDPFALSLEAYRLPLQCPRKWARHFASLEAPREVVERFVPPDPARPGAHNPIVGTTWLHPQFALGSVNRGDFRAQRRPLLAYWGTPDAPRFLRARFLKNGADFSSALLFSVQHQGHVLGVAVLSTDHGDSFPAAAPIPARTLAARQLRLVFEFGGTLGRCTVRAASDATHSVLVQDEPVRLLLQPVADAFGTGRVRWEQPELSLARPVSAVAHDGEDKTFDLQALGEVFVCFTLSGWAQGEKPPPPEPVQIQRDPGRLRARWAVAGKTLDLQVPTKPAPFAELNDQFRGVVG